jgi:hypothetical protein
MGLSKGFVTGLGLPYSAQHRALGNGVVPRQAAVALWRLMEIALKELSDKGPCQSDSERSNVAPNLT